MLRLLFLLITFSFPIGLGAQSTPISGKLWHQISGSGLFGSDQEGNQIGFALNWQSNYVFSDRWSAGLGIGMHSLSNNDLYFLPVVLQAQETSFIPIAEKWGFLQLQGGVNLPFEASKNVEVQGEPGWFFRPEIGLLHPMGEQVQLLTSLGYLYHFLPIEIEPLFWWDETSRNRDIGFQRWSVTVGILF